MSTSRTPLRGTELAERAARGDEYAIRRVRANEVQRRWKRGLRDRAANGDEDAAFMVERAKKKKQLDQKARNAREKEKRENGDPETRRRLSGMRGAR